MIIRSAQFSALASESERAFVNRVLQFMHDEFPDSLDIPEPEFRNEITAQIRKAESYNLRTEQQIATYVAAAYLLGNTFDQQFPAAREVLPSALYTSDEKMEWLDSWVRAV
jgi:hypothetical protein